MEHKGLYKLNSPVALLECATPSGITSYGQVWASSSDHLLHFTNASGTSYTLTQGTGTANYLTKWSNTTGGLTNSVIQDDGTRIGIGTAPDSVDYIKANGGVLGNCFNATGGISQFIASSVTLYNVPAYGGLRAVSSAGGATKLLLINSEGGNVGINVAGASYTNATEALSVGGRISLAETTAPTATSGYGKYWVSSTSPYYPFFMDRSGNTWLGWGGRAPSDYSYFGPMAGNTTSTAHYNVAIGPEALLGVSSGTYNVVMGNRAGYSITTAAYNVLLGHQAGYYTNASSSTLVGYGVLGYAFSQTGALSTFSGTAVGNLAAYMCAAGTGEAFGVNAMGRVPGSGAYTVTSVSDNGSGKARFNCSTTVTIIAGEAVYSTVTGYLGTKVTTAVSGTYFETADTFVSTGTGTATSVYTGNYNQLFGNSAGYSMTTASNSVGIGTNSLLYMRTGTGNIAIGRDTLYYTAQTNAQTFVGYAAGKFAGTYTTGSRLTSGYGYQSGQSDCGSQSSSFGSYTGSGNLTVYSVSSVADNGSGKARFTTSSNHEFYFSNIYVFLYNSSKTAYPTGVYQITYVSPNQFDITSLTYTETATANVIAAMSGNYNTSVGSSAGGRLMTGDQNTFVGVNAGSGIRTGSANTYIGMYTGQYNYTGSGNCGVGKYCCGGELSAYAFTATSCSDNGSGKVRVNKTSHGVKNGEYVWLQTGIYQGVWQATYVDADKFDLTAVTYSSTSAPGITVISSGNQNIGLGYYCNTAVTSGSYNVGVGSECNNVRTGNYNVGIGWRANNGIILGSQNIAIGIYTLRTVVAETGTGWADNIAIGAYSLYNCGSTGNVCIGANTGYSNAASGRNVHIGYQAGRYNTEGSTLIIDSSSNARTDEATEKTLSLLYGKFDTTVGSQYLRINGALELPERAAPTATSGYGKHWVSSTSPYYPFFMDRSGTTWLGWGGYKDSNNNYFGPYAGLTTLSQTGNTGVGVEALGQISSGAGNTAYGYRAGYSTTTGTYLTAIGWGAAGFVSANNLTAIGYSAVGYGFSQTGALSTFSGTVVGGSAAYCAYSGSGEAFGYVALGQQPAGINGYTVTSVSDNGSGKARFNIGVAVRLLVGEVVYSSVTGYTGAKTVTAVSTTSSSGYFETADTFVSTGTGTALPVYSGNYNQAFGSNAMRYCTSGAGNVAIGLQAMLWNRTGSSNIAIGRDVFYYATTPSYATGIGYQVGNTLRNPNYSTLVGGRVAQSAVDIGGASENTASIGIGYRALRAAYKTASSVAIGSAALDVVTAPSKQFTATADAGGGNMTVTCNAHGLANSATITIYGSYYYDGNYTISNVATNTFDIVKTFVGTDAGWFCWQDGAGAIAQRNVAIGMQTLTAARIASSETAIGFAAASTLRTSQGAGVFIGSYAGNNMGVNNYSIAIGASAMNNASGVRYQPNNIAIGGRTMMAVGARMGWITNIADAGGGNVTITSAAHGLSNGDSVYVGGFQYLGDGTKTVANKTTDTFDVVGTYQLWDKDTRANNCAYWYRISEAMNNTTVGYEGMTALTYGNYNTGYGYANLHDLTIGGYNVAFGYNAGHRITTVSNTVNIGSMAGYFNTAGSTLIIDSTSAGRTDEATEAAQSLIYGKFDAAVANQYVRINGHLELTERAAPTSTSGYGKYWVSSTSPYYPFFMDRSGNTWLGWGGKRPASYTYFSPFAGNTSTTANFNTAVGVGAGAALDGGSENTLMGGYRVGYLISSGSYNCGYGIRSLEALTTGNYNVAMGHNSMSGCGTGATGNTAVGVYAGASTASNYGVFLGYMAGRYETAGSALYIDNRDRTDINSGKTLSLIYGTFAATVADQMLRINGALELTERAAPSSTSGYGKLWTSSTSPYSLHFMDRAGTDFTFLMSNGTKVSSSVDLEIASDKAYYMGDTTTDGSWRFIRSGNNLNVERRESGSWVSKGTFTA